MIDTNQVAQVISTATTVHAQLSPYLPAAAVAAAWAGREIRNFNLWLFDLCEYFIAHGGIGWWLWKIVWNPPQSPNLK